MQKKKHIIVLLTIFCVLQVFFVNTSIAIDNIGFNDKKILDYSETYKKGEELSNGDKVKSGVIPRKYNVPLDSIYEDTITVKENPNLFNLFGLLSKEKVVSANAEEIPTEFNLSEEINILVENQGEEGLCWAFASLTSLETNLTLKGYGEYDFSERHIDYLTSVGFGGNRYLGDAGNFDVFTDYISKNNGPVLEATVPYNTEYTSDQYEYLNSLQSEAYVIEKIDFPTINKSTNNYSEEDLLLFRNKVKKHIMKNGSIYANILSEGVNTAFFEDDSVNYTLYNTSDNVDHAVSIIGWDDNYPRENFRDINENMPKNNGAYIALNSWGETAKIVYISYEDYTVEREMSGIVTSTTDINEVGTMEVIFNDINLYNSMKAIFSKAIISSNDETKSINFLGCLSELETSIDISRKNIQDLSGLEKFKLQLLTAYSNNISDIKSLRNSTDICFLDLRDNELSDISTIENLTNLKELYLDYNNVSNLNPLKENKNLEILSIYKNKVSDISALANLTNLKELDLSLNEILNIDSLKNLINLRILKISDNNISDISGLVNLTNLKELDLSQNEISNINSLENLAEVEYLNITNNKISDIGSVDKLTKLKELWGAYNNISNINSLANLESLEILSIGSNNIEDISVLYNLENLEHLNLNYNNIEKQISLSENKIITVPLPNIVIEAQKAEGIIYSEEGIELQNCNLSQDNTSVEIDTSKNLNASVKINSGYAEGTTFNIIVKNNVIKVTIKEFPKKTYQKGEEIDLKGGIITVTYENGNTEEVLMSDSKVTVEGYNKDTIGTQAITVKFGEQSDVFYIEVAGNGKVESDKLTIIDDEKEPIIKGIMPNTAPSKVIEAIKSSETFEILDLNNNIISNSNKIGTGFKIKLLSGKTYTLVVYGDITGDGVISISELAAASRAAAGSTLSIERAKFMAIDINNDGNIKVSDLSVISRLRNQQ